jgi:four helix bundle protein
MHQKSFRDLPVWQRSTDLAVEVYRLAKRLPRNETFCLSAQMRRAAVSVSSNIAEGSGRATTPDLRNFLSYSRGSVKETESLVLVSQKLDFFSASDVAVALELTDEISRMLSGYRRSLRRR